MITFRLTSIVAIAISLTACAIPPKYSWGNYDRSLYNYYKDSTKLAEHLTELESLIADAEKTGNKVAPGIHAEYGYLLQEQGRKTEAISQFEKEKSKWPESAQFMNVMIQSVSVKSTNNGSKE
jgi:hypothetical protein